MSLLSAMLALSLLGAVSVYLVSRASIRYGKLLTLGVALANLLLSVLVYLDYRNNPSAWFPAEVVRDWPLSKWGVSYVLGVDGISLPLVLLTTLVMVAAIIASWDYITFREREYYPLMLILGAGVLGVFMALDFFVFYVFWEIVLIPMFFLIGVWGGPRREYSAMKFFVYTHVGSLAMILGIVALYLRVGTSDMAIISYLIATRPDMFPLEFQKIVFLALFLGFAFKMPSVPFHTWLPDAHVEAPSPVSVVLAALLLKMGGYGLIRVNAMMLPEALKAFALAVALYGILSIFYAAFVCMVQSDVKRLIAYSSISHMGFVVLGVASLNTLGINGAVFQMVSHGLISGLLFILSGLLLEKAGSREVSQLGGIVKKLPVTGWTLVFASMASLGLPTLSGFVAELTVFLGAYLHYGAWIIIPVVSIVVTSGYYIWMLQKVAFGAVHPRLEKIEHEHMHLSENVSMALLVIFIVLLGIYPAPLIDLITTTSQDVAHILGGR